MNFKEAYERELDRLRTEKMSDALDLFADDIWFHMGRENEALFLQAAIDDDQGEMGRICAVAISNCLHKLVDHNRVADLCSAEDLARCCDGLDRANREAKMRDDQERRQGLKEEMRRTA